MIHKNPISFIGHVKRNIFICDFGSGSSVFIKHIDYLSVLDKCCKLFSKSIYPLSCL